MKKDLSYYEVSLKVFLHEISSPKASDESFIEDRAEHAAAEYEQQRLAGLSPASAQECAMKVLFDGFVEPDDTVM